MLDLQRNKYESIDNDHDGQWSLPQKILCWGIISTVACFAGTVFLGAGVAAYNILLPGNDSDDDQVEYSNLGIENASDLSFELTGTTQQDASCADYQKPDACAQSLPQLAQQWVRIQQATNGGDNGWIDLEYDVKDSSGNYRGHFGVRLTPQEVTISNADGVSVSLGSYQAGKPQTVTVDKRNCDITANVTLPVGELLKGMDHSGFEWGHNVGEINPPTCEDIQTALEHQFVSLRVPFKLEYGSPDGLTIDRSSQYVRQYLEYVANITGHGAQAVVEPHNYMEFRGQPITPEQCRNLIGSSFADLFVGMDNIVFEAMNEPTHSTPEELFACYDGLIKAARARGFNGTIAIEGSLWGSPGAWTNADGSGSQQFKVLEPLFTNPETYGDVQMAIHTYFNGASGGGTGLTECVPANTALALNRIPELTALAREHGIKIRITEMGVIKTANCETVLEDVLQHIYANQDVYVAYNWWTQTPHNWQYPLRITPGDTSDPRVEVMQTMPGFKPQNDDGLKAKANSNIDSAQSSGSALSSIFTDMSCWLASQLINFVADCPASFSPEAVLAAKAVQGDERARASYKAQREIGFYATPHSPVSSVASLAPASTVASALESAMGFLR